MSLTIIDLDQAWLEGQERARQYQAAWEAAWRGPIIMAERVQEILTATPQEVEALRAEDPELFEKLNVRIKQLRKRLNYGNSTKTQYRPRKTEAETSST
jgi:hypothetical protein